jgi:hypothetical protein
MKIKAADLIGLTNEEQRTVFELTRTPEEHITRAGDRRNMRASTLAQQAMYERQAQTELLFAIAKMLAYPDSRPGAPVESGTVPAACTDPSCPEGGS